MARYEQRVDREHPGLIVFMVDQSHSMADPIAGSNASNASKASVVAEQLNAIMFELIQRCTKSHAEPPRPYFAVSVIGYSSNEEGDPEVGFRLGGDLAGRDVVLTNELAQRPLRVETRTRPGTGKEISYRFPVWFEPTAQGGTPMCAAFDLAGRVVRSWVDNFPTTFPPIVINLSDGEPTDGDVRVWGSRLRGLQTGDGPVLVFNLAISATASVPLMFPNTDASIDDPFGRTLFEMSSLLPDFMLSAAKIHGFRVELGARGFGMNADLRSLVTFLNIGTAVGHLLR